MSTSRQIAVAGVLLTLVTLLLLSCTPAQAPTLTPTPTPQATKAPQAVPTLAAVPSKPGWQAEWDKTLDAAKKEGVVAFATSTGPATKRDLAAAFQDRFGLRTEAMMSPAGVIMSKILTERRAGLYLWDVMIAGSSAHYSVWKPGGGTAPMEPNLILPDFTDPAVMKQVWFEGKLPWIDKEHHMMGALWYPGTELAINTTMVKPDEIQTWDDLLNPKWKGKMLLMDPTLPGTNCDGELIPLLFDVKGEEWVRKFVAQEPIIVRDDRTAHEWLSHGKNPIYMPPRGELWPEFLAAGAPIALVFPKAGSVVTAGPAAVSGIDKPAHPNAAKIFLNWVLGKEGITIISKTRMQQTARMDVPTDFLPSYALRKEGVKYWVKDREEILNKVADLRVKSKEVFASVLPK